MFLIKFKMSLKSQEKAVPHIKRRSLGEKKEALHTLNPASVSAVARARCGKGSRGQKSSWPPLHTCAFPGQAQGDVPAQGTEGHPASLSETKVPSYSATEGMGT